MWKRQVVEIWEELILQSRSSSISPLHPKSALRTTYPRLQSRPCRRQLGAPAEPWRNMARVWYRNRCSTGAKLEEWTSGPFLAHRPCASSTGFYYHECLLIWSSDNSYKRITRAELSRMRYWLSTGLVHWHKVWTNTRVKRFEWREASLSPIESIRHASPAHLPLVTITFGLSSY